MVSIYKKFKVADLSVSIFVVQELFAGANSKQQENQILALISSLKVWPYSQEIAKFAGELIRDSKKQVSVIDAAIAATCLINNCHLATLNSKDFAGIPKLQMVRI